MIRILSIDGGGIRGIIPSVVLSNMADDIGKPLHEAFDLIVGTSTGGIIALMLSMGYTPQDILSFYVSKNRDIFNKAMLPFVKRGFGLFGSKYGKSGIYTAAKDIFGDTRMGAAKTNVMVSSYDMIARSPVFFKSWKDPEICMLDAALATSAAPAYFPAHEINHDGSTKLLIDGGVGVNNPAVSGYSEALRVWPDKHNDDFLVVSLGTGLNTRPYMDVKQWGLVKWATPLLNVIFDATSDACDYQMHHILGDRYLRLQTELDLASDDLDNTSADNISALIKQGHALVDRNRMAFSLACSQL